MFDRYTISRTPSDVHVNVTEKRAPTDESIRLLREMEQAAEKRILDSVRVANQQFECVIHKAYSHVDAEYTFVAVFKLNGKKMKAKFMSQLSDPTKEEIAIGLRDAVAKEIANEIAPAFSAVDWRV